MLKRIAAITGIFIISCVAWLILTLVIWVRTDERSASISRMVGDLWGTEHTQVAPELSARWATESREEVRWTGRSRGRSGRRRPTGRACSDTSRPPP